MTAGGRADADAERGDDSVNGSGGGCGGGGGRATTGCDTERDGDDVTRGKWSTAAAVSCGTATVVAAAGHGRSAARATGGGEQGRRFCAPRSVNEVGNRPRFATVIINGLKVREPVNRPVRPVSTTTTTAAAIWIVSLFAGRLFFFPFVFLRVGTARP